MFSIIASSFLCCWVFFTVSFLGLLLSKLVLVLANAFSILVEVMVVMAVVPSFLALRLFLLVLSLTVVPFSVRRGSSFGCQRACLPLFRVGGDGVCGGGD